jgi:hypothetical protein
MSLPGVAASSIFQFLNPSAQSNAQNFQKEFQQLGQDLSSGNLSAAQQDYSTVQQDLQQSSAASGARFHYHRHGASSSQNSSQNPIDQIFANLAQALQSNNRPPSSLSVPGHEGGAFLFQAHCGHACGEKPKTRFMDES